MLVTVAGIENGLRTIPISSAGNFRGLLIASTILVNFPFYAESAKYLHRAGRRTGKFVLHSRAGMAFDDDWPDTVVRKEKRHGEPIQAAAT